MLPEDTYKCNYVFIPCYSTDINQIYAIDANERTWRKEKVNKASAQDLIKSAYKLMQRLSQNETPVHGKILSFNHKRELTGFDKNDTLYINAHGAPDLIGTDGHGISLSPTQLAEMLANAGLSKELGRIKVYACQSASPPREGLHNATKPYAQALLEALEQLGYTQTDVIGYFGNLTEIKDKSKKMHSIIKVGGGAYERASALRLTFLSTNTRQIREDVEAQNELSQSLRSSCKAYRKRT